MFKSAWLALLACLGLYLTASDAMAVSCTINGGSVYNTCEIAPVRYSASKPEGGTSGAVFATRADAAIWLTKYWQDNTAQYNQPFNYLYWGKCNYGVFTHDACVARGDTDASCNAYSTPMSENRYYDGPSSVFAWGFEVNEYYPAGHIAVCRSGGTPWAPYATVSATPSCKPGWNTSLEYLGPDHFVYYCARQIEPDGTVDGSSTADRSGVCASCGLNPVNLLTGSKYDTATDYTNYSPFPIQWTRFYSSAAQAWHFNYNRKVLGFTHNPSTQEAFVSVEREDGTFLAFKSSNADPAVAASSWTWTPVIAAGSNAVLSTFAVFRPANGTVQGYTLKNLRGETEHFDSLGRMIQLDDEQGHSLHFQFNSQNNLSRITDDAGRHLDIEYPAPTAYSYPVADPAGASNPDLAASYGQWPNELAALQAAQGLPSRITDGVSEINYSYQPIGNGLFLNKIVQADGATVQYAYGESSLANRSEDLTGIIGADGARFATYKYTNVSGTSRSAVAESTHGVGLRKISYSLASDTIKDAYEHSFVYGSGSKYITGKPSGFQTPCPSETCGGEGATIKNITWDTYGNPLTTTDFNNQVKTFVWDAPRALPLAITEATGTPLERTTTFTWHATKRLPLIKVEPIKVGATTGTRTTTWTYDNLGHVLTEVVSNSINSSVRTQGFTYNAAGLLESATNARGKSTITTYDAQGNLLTEINPLNQTTTWSNYTLRGLPGRMVDANGLATEFTYDNRDRLTQVRRGSAGTHWETWGISWLAINQMDRITRPDGLSYKMLYDSAHDLAEIQERSATDALLGKQVFTLDLMGRMTKVETFNGSSVKESSHSQTWNALSRLATSVGASSQTTTLTYDADGNMTGVYDPLSHSRTKSVDALGRTLTMVDALTHSSTVAYDVQDNQTGAVDQRGVSTGYAYNAFNDLLAVSSPDRGTWTYAVDANRNRIQTTDPRGVVADTILDDLDRPVSVNWNSSSVSSSAVGFDNSARAASYTWDTCTNGLGRLCQLSDHSGITSYTYDLWGRLTGQAFAPAGESFTLATGFGYDTAGRRVSVVYPSGKTLLYTFGTDGRLASQAWAGTPVLGSITHLAMGGPISGWAWSAVGLPTGKQTVAFSFDLDGQMTQISDIDTITLVHDDDSRLTAKDYLTQAAHSQVYTYDAEDRLTSADTSVWSGVMGYQYDNVGNRTKKTFAGSDVFQNAYGSTNNRLTSITPVSGGILGTSQAYTYDAMGNTVNNGLGDTYTFDSLGRMSSANTGVAIVSFAVGTNGLRTRKTTSPGAKDTFYVYDDARRLIGAYTPHGRGGFTAKEELIYLGDDWKIVGTVRGQMVSGANGTVYPVLSDQLGTPRVVLDPANGNARWTWEAKEAFGYQSPNEKPGQAQTFVFNARFPGQWFDAETYLYQNGYRDYDPKVGRYVQSDPIGLGGGWNTYGYVGGSPTDAVDRLGLKLVEPSSNTAAGLAYYREVNKLRSLSPTFDYIYRTVRDSRTFSLTVEASGSLPKNSMTAGYVKGVDTGLLKWNPGIVLACGPYFPDRKHNAMQGLAHEFGHAFNEANRSMIGISRPDIDTEEEFWNLPLERQIFKEAGLSAGRTLFEYNFGSYQSFEEW